MTSRGRLIKYLNENKFYCFDNEDEFETVDGVLYIKRTGIALDPNIKGRSRFNGSCDDRDRFYFRRMRLELNELSEDIRNRRLRLENENLAPTDIDALRDRDGNRYQITYKSDFDIHRYYIEIQDVLQTPILVPAEEFNQRLGRWCYYDIRISCNVDVFASFIFYDGTELIGARWNNNDTERDKSFEIKQVQNLLIKGGIIPEDSRLLFYNREHNEINFEFMRRLAIEFGFEKYEIWEGEIEDIRFSDLGVSENYPLNRPQEVRLFRTIGEENPQDSPKRRVRLSPKRRVRLSPKKRVRLSPKKRVRFIKQ